MDISTTRLNRPRGQLNKSLIKNEICALALPNAVAQRKSAKWFVPSSHANSKIRLDSGLWFSSIHHEGLASLSLLHIPGGFTWPVHCMHNKGQLYGHMAAQQNPNIGLSSLYEMWQTKKISITYFYAMGIRYKISYYLERLLPQGNMILVQYFVSPQEFVSLQENNVGSVPITVTLKCPASNFWPF